MDNSMIDTKIGFRSQNISKTAGDLLTCLQNPQKPINCDSRIRSKVSLGIIGFWNTEDIKVSGHHMKHGLYSLCQQDREPITNHYSVQGQIQPVSVIHSKRTYRKDIVNFVADPPVKAFDQLHETNKLMSNFTINCHVI